jgi:cell fate (sporulation/competence/biofilm development) regulator YmcA (YheA/YmcA/DUF963 family)
MINDTVQQIEENIKQAQEIVEFDKALSRLMENRDFRKVIKEGYLEKEAIRLVHLRGDPAFQTPERQAAVIGQIDAIGQLLSYFRTVKHNAAIALKAIETDEAVRDELIAEGDM